MAEILTESFCERCGTRYTFEATGPRRWGVGRIRTLTRGVKNFVVNDAASFTEAMAAARDDDARSASTQQLDAFHATFNFCLSCRQYTCRNCWNEGASECLSCVPEADREVMPGTIPDLAIVGSGGPATPLLEPAHANLVASVWPTSDLPPGVPLALAPGPRESALAPPVIPAEVAAPVEIPAAAEVAEVAAPVEIPAAAEVAEVAAPVETPPELVPVAREPELELTSDELAAVERALARHVSQPDGDLTAAPAEVGEPTPMPAPTTAPAFGAHGTASPSADAPEPIVDGRAETRRLLRRFRPRPERAVPAVTASASARPADLAVTPTVPAVAPAVDAAMLRAVAPEVEAAAPAPQAGVKAVEPVAARAPEAIRETPAASPREAVEPAPAASPPPPTDHVEQPTWRMIAPEAAQPGEQEPPPAAWAAPRTITRRAADALPSAPWAARVATARPLESPVWAASSRDILAAEAPGAAGPVGVQSCVSCGLSLSANARFCRRCGTRQG